MTPKINLLVGGVAILCFGALVFVPWDEEKIAPEIVNISAEEEQIVCIELWQPVCSINGVTYSNSCYLGAAGDTLDHDGEC